MSFHEEKEENNNSAPAYLVTFSDMVTLLLTFFVMLLSLAQDQEAELFRLGQQSFIQAVERLGIGMLRAKDGKSQFGNVMIKYHIDNPDDSESAMRTLDARRERMRRLFEDVKDKTSTRASNIKGERTQFSVTSIRFGPGSSLLNEAAREYLDDFCSTLQQSVQGQKLQICVVGLSREASSSRQKWILSAKRAKSVADYVRDRVEGSKNWPVHSWGAGPGGQWTDKDSPLSEQCQILIAVLREGYG